MLSSSLSIFSSSIVNWSNFARSSFANDFVSYLGSLPTSFIYFTLLYILQNFQFHFASLHCALLDIYRKKRPLLKWPGIDTNISQRGMFKWGPVLLWLVHWWIFFVLWQFLLPAGNYCVDSDNEHLHNKNLSAHPINSIFI